MIAFMTDIVTSRHESLISKAREDLEIIARFSEKRMRGAGAAAYRAVKHRSTANYLESMAFFGIEVEKDGDHRTEILAGIFKVAGEKGSKTSTLAIDLAFSIAGTFHEAADTQEDIASELEAQLGH